MIILTVNEDKSIEVDVDNPDGTAKDITGATFETAARSPSGANKTLTIIITNAVQGKVTITIPKDTIDVHGSWFGQCEMSLGSTKTTIWQEVILAKASIF